MNTSSLINPRHFVQLQCGNHLSCVAGHSATYYTLTDYDKKYLGSFTRNLHTGVVEFNTDRFYLPLPVRSNTLADCAERTRDMLQRHLESLIEKPATMLMVYWLLAADNEIMAAGDCRDAITSALDAGFLDVGINK